MALVLVLLASLLSAIYTFNYARWAWRRTLWFGAIGLILLGIAAVAVPAWVFWFLS